MKRRQLIAGLIAAGALNAVASASEDEKIYEIELKIGSQTFTADLEDNASTRELISRLPLSFTIDDLYGRELCYHFAKPLPAHEEAYRGYEVGEIIYWPPRHSFVIMYEQNGERFSMQSLGRIRGSLDRLPRGSSPVTITLVR